MNQQNETQKLQAIKLKRLKFAQEAYADHKTIYTDPVTEERLEGYLEWHAFRDEFLADWINNRRPIDEQEDQVTVDKLVDEALGELDALGVSVDINVVADQVESTLEVVADADTATETVETAGEVVVTIPVDVATTAPKRRGRPPGSGKKQQAIAVEANDAGSVELVNVAPKRRGRPPGSGKAKAVVAKPALKKAAAKKKAGGNKAEKARGIIAKFGPKGRKWERKDVIAKLVSQLDLSPATASTYYQNYK